MAELPTIGVPHLRSQDLKNKQASHDDLDPEFVELMENKIATLYHQSQDLYDYMLSKGVAKECARSILPLGTPTQMYMSMSIRTAVHYCHPRRSGTQLEHRMIAEDIKGILEEHLPNVYEAAFCD